MLDFRFPTALQMVLSVAVAEKQGMRSTSATLAAALEANPSFIRKLMVPLTKDGIIVSTLGRNGSIHLGRPAEEITLRDIYLAVIDDKRIWASRPEVPGPLPGERQRLLVFQIGGERSRTGFTCGAGAPYRGRFAGRTGAGRQARLRGVRRRARG
ncbi:hypothetical protein SM14VA2_12560 [Serratia marcescens]|nr:hypothetical protein SM14VA2_12560 [Serratia marcescens]